MDVIKSIKQEFEQGGIGSEHIEYAYSAIMDGIRRELIINNLVNQRGVNESKSHELLNRLYLLNGGEFKVENRRGYMSGITIIGAAIVLVLYSIVFRIFRPYEKQPTISGKNWRDLFAQSFRIFGATFKGKYREEMDVFNDEI